MRRVLKDLFLRIGDWLALLFRPSRPREIVFVYSWEDSPMKGQLILPVAAMRVTKRILEFKVGESLVSVELGPEAVASEKFEVQDGDLVEGALVDENKWGKSLPRTFSFVVEFPGVAPEQPGLVTLELSDEQS